MRILLLITVVLSAEMLLLQPIETSAHGLDHHGDHMNVQMQKLHAMMPIFSVASAELELAIEKGDATVAKAQADRILAAVPDLTRSKPHKNLKSVAAFKSIATKLGSDVKTVRTLAEKGDFPSAKVAFKKMELRCQECHTRFRD